MERNFCYSRPTQESESGMLPSSVGRRKVLFLERQSPRITRRSINFYCDPYHPAPRRVPPESNLKQAAAGLLFKGLPFLNAISVGISNFNTHSLGSIVKRRRSGGRNPNWVDVAHFITGMETRRTTCRQEGEISVLF